MRLKLAKRGFEVVGVKNNARKLSDRKTASACNIEKGCGVRDSIYDKPDHYTTVIAKSAVQGNEVQEEETYETMEPDPDIYSTMEELEDTDNLYVITEDGVREETYEALEDITYTTVTVSTTVATMPRGCGERESGLYDN